MKIPKYVRELVEQGRLRPAPLDEQAKAEDGVYGYMFRLYRYSNGSGILVSEAKRLVAWANRQYAEAKLHYCKWYTTKEHRKPYYMRDYALVTITDPVAQQLEKLITEVSKRR